MTNRNARPPGAAPVAFADLCRFFLDQQQVNVGGRHRPHLNVFVDYEDLVANDDTCANGSTSEPSRRDTATGWLADGTVLDSATIRRLLCDAGVHRIVTQGRSAILDYGHTTRTISAALFAALVARDLRCRFPSCDRHPAWCEAHHLVAWEHGGPTTLANLALFCSRHHHLLHSPQWQAKVRPAA